MTEPAPVAQTDSKQPKQGNGWNLSIGSPISLFRVLQRPSAESSHQFTPHRRQTLSCLRITTLHQQHAPGCPPRKTSSYHDTICSFFRIVIAGTQDDCCC